MVDKPADLRRRLAIESNPELEPESVLPVVGDPDSSSTSSFGCSDPDEPAIQRPTGLTGDDRIRPKTRAELLEKYGPQLKIALSAERVLLGKDNDASEHPSPHSPSAQDYGKGFKPMPKYEHASLPRAPSGHSQIPRDTSGSRLYEKLAPGMSRDVPNFCRPQLPSDSYSRKSDLSGRELSIHRNPSSERSFTNLRGEGENYSPEDVPPVPKVPGLRKSESKKAIESDEYTAPRGGTPEFYAEMASRVDPFTLAGPLDSPHLRSSSIQAQAGSNVTPQSHHEAPNDSALTRKGSNAHIDDIVQDQEHHGRPDNAGRLPDSKSTRMLDSFRSIFSKSRSGVEKGATGKEQLAGNSSVRRSRNAAEGAQSGKVDHAAMKTRAKWSKSSRNLKGDEISSPMPLPAPSLMPSPDSCSPFPAPQSRGRQDSHTPSFARSTQATRTRAAASAKQPSVSQEARMHRIKVLTPSTGSPSRAARIQKRTNQLTATTPNPHSQAGSDSERPNPPEKDTPVSAKLADTGRIGVDSVQEGIESLCAKICENSMPMKRTKYLRVGALF